MSVAVTVLMPVYNAAPFLKEAIESILNQTFDDFEFLIINDGSKDPSAEIIALYTDERIRIISHPENKGLVVTLNEGLDLAEGKYIVRMDADDISMPERISKQVAFMEMHSNIGLCGTYFEQFSDYDKMFSFGQFEVGDAMIRLKQHYKIQVCHGTSILRKSLFDKYSLRFDANYRHAEDFELWTRVSRYTQMANIPEVLYQVRLHDNNVSKEYKAIQDFNTRQIIKNQFAAYGIQIASDAELDLFLDIAYANFKNIKPFLKKAETFLVNWKNANDRKKILPQLLLNKYVGEKWFHICYNTSRLGWISYMTYKNSILSKFFKISLFQKAKFLLRTILQSKSKYKEKNKNTQANSSA